MTSYTQHEMEDKFQSKLLSYLFKKDFSLFREELKGRYNSREGGKAIKLQKKQGHCKSVPNGPNDHQFFHMYTFNNWQNSKKTQSFRKY